jgi:hypothetical protein
MEFYTSISSFADIIKQSSDLQQLIIAARNLELLNKAVLEFFGSEYRQNLKVAKLDNGLLILASKDQSWNHKVRFKSYELLSYLRRNPKWMAIRDVKCVVNLELLNGTSYCSNEFSQAKFTELQDRYEAFPKPTPPTAIAAQNIKQTSSYVKNEQLAESLQRFAKLFIKSDM